MTSPPHQKTTEFIHHLVVLWSEQNLARIQKVVSLLGTWRPCRESELKSFFANYPAGGGCISPGVGRRDPVAGTFLSLAP